MRSARDWQSLSVRSRFVLAIGALTALAMAMVGVLLWVLGMQSMERDEAADVTREFAEFERLQDLESPSDQRLRDFLARNVPDDDELHVIYIDGDPDQWIAGGDRAEWGDWDAFVQSPEYLDALDRAVRAGRQAEYTDPTYGEAWVSALEVEESGLDRALVIVTFLDDERAEMGRTIQLYALACLAALAVAALLAWVIAGRLLAPIRVLRATTHKISGSDVSRRIPVTGNDDLTSLARAVNAMLDRLEGGLEEQRRFLDDVGHELRTPLTVIGGHLELLDSSDQGEVDHTRELVLDETDRMARLVEDLIMLAKSRRPDFVIPQPTSLPVLIEGIHAKAAALGDRDWRLEMGAPSVTPGGDLVTLDAQRITQAMLQLVDNAVKHTDVGDRITIGASRTPGHVRFWVRDTGDGIAEEDRETIFERFGRSAVRETDGGFGLGLSIVAAIATAHRGRVDLVDAAGQTEFRLTLPLAPDDGRLSPAG